MAKQDISIGELIAMHHRGELQLPAIQRGYVWKAPRVRDLLDSLYRGYPSGSILVWETDAPVTTREFAVGQGTTAFAGRKLLLDGQQRVTSLAAVLSGQTVQVRGRKRPIEILFNLDHPEAVEDGTDVDDDAADPLLPDDDATDTAEEEDEQVMERIRRMTFVVSSRNIASQRNWVKLTDIFGTKSDAQILRDAGLTGFDDPRYETYTRRLKRVKAIRDYLYVMHVLGRDLSYEEVTEIFVRVNSLGVKLRSSDLALAQVSCRWTDVLEELEKFQKECEERQFTLDTGLLLRAMVVFTTHQCLFKPVATVDIVRLKEGWSQAQEGLRFAINFLISNAGIEDESLLSAPTLMVPMAVFSHLKSNRLTEKESAQLRQWLLLANVRGRYSRGSSETLLNQDLAALYANKGPEALIENLKQQVGRLTIDAADFVGRGANSPLFHTAYLALKAAGASDWYSGLGLSLAHQGKLHFVQYHHIFPKSLLRAHAARYEKAEINEVTNFAFIGGQTNRRISNKEPAAYLEAIVKERGEQALTSQCVPTDRSLWQLDKYREFLAERRRLLAEKIQDHMDKSG
jgi:hypothetical protein